MIVKLAQIKDAQIIYQIGLAAFGTEQLPLSVIEHEIASPRASYFISSSGFAGVTHILDELEINYLAVDPKQQGQGQGRALLEAVLALSGVHRFLLEVAADNVVAQALYRKLGFSEYYRRRAYYRNGEDAIMMEKIND